MIEHKPPCSLNVDAVVGHRITRYDLSPRQATALRLVLLGHDNTEIATRMRIGLRTAKTHVEILWKKLGVHSRAQLMGSLFKD